MIRPPLFAACVCVFSASSGCNSILNGWLSPIELGSFTRESTLDIRGSLSIQDTPAGVRGATEPAPDDLMPSMQEYRTISGDVLNVFIHELRDRGVESATQATVDSRGMINLPVVGWVRVQGLTAREIEDRLREVLTERQILFDADVLVQFAAQRGLTFTIFGNESLAVQINRGPGAFPIPRSDFRLIEAISVSGGLSELVNSIYVFRQRRQDRLQAEALEEIRRQQQGADLNDEPGKTPDAPDAGQPLPGVLSASHGGAPRLASVVAQVTRIPSVVDQPPSTGQPEPAEPEPREKSAGDLATEVQEILDMMAQPPEGAPPTPQAERPPTPPAEQPPAGDRREAEIPPVRAPSGWIFDQATRRWIPAEPPGRVVDRPVPFVPPDEDAVIPAIDWDAIAGDEYDIRTIRISAEGLRQGDPRYNIVVRPDDIIRLYSGDIGFYYVMGHVNRPGTYQFRSGASVTLKNAIASAGGLDALAWPDRVSVYRRVGGREQLIQVDMDRIFAGLDADFYLKRDDIINVGTHPVAPFLLSIRNLTIPRLDSAMSFTYQWTRSETFFKTENFGQQQTGSGLFP